MRGTFREEPEPVVATTTGGPAVIPQAPPAEGKRGLWRDLVSENPMLGEIQRVRRRLFMVGNRTVTGSVLVLLGLTYVAFLGLTIANREVLPPEVVLTLQLGLLCFLSPALLYGAIAGERERRSWELLLVAPITPAQIVVGKFFGALAAIGISGLLFLPPILIAAIFSSNGQYLLNALIAEAMIGGFIAMVCAFTLLISARVRRPFVALGTTLGTLAVLLIMLPALMAALMSGTSNTDLDFAFFGHPFYVLFSLTSTRDGLVTNPLLFGIPQTLIYLLFTVIFLVWTERTLKFADNEVRFLPKKETDA